MLTVADVLAGAFALPPLPEPPVPVPGGTTCAVTGAPIAEGYLLAPLLQKSTAIILDVIRGRIDGHLSDAAARCQQQQANAQKRARLAAGIEKPSTPYVRRWRQIRPEQAAALRAREREKARAAYHELPPEQQAAILARAHQSDQAGYTETLKRATSSGRVWTPEEDEYVRAHLTMPARDVGVRLGRTLWAVRNRRNKLRRDADEQRTLT